MIQKKILLSTVSTEINGEVHRPRVFTADSYIIIKILSRDERMKIAYEIQGYQVPELSDDELAKLGENALETRNAKTRQLTELMLKAIGDVVISVSATTIEGDVVSDWNDLTAFADGDIVSAYLSKIITQGYQPSKKSVPI